MPLKKQIKDKKAIGLSFKVSIQDTEDLDSGKSIEITIQEEAYTLKRKTTKATK